VPQTVQDAAHDLCNQLQIILTYCERNPALASSIVLDATMRARDIAKSLFKTTPAIPPGTFDLNEATFEVFDALQQHIDPTKVEVAFDPCIERFFHVAGDSTKWHRALWNLCVNGLAAVAKHPDGRIGIQTLLFLGKAVVTVSDNGIGMTEEQVAELWKRVPAPEDPHGRGFGIVRATVFEMNGAMTVLSVVGSGTTFSITLPLSTSL
jgi:signal transduction histidine kinase